MSAVSAVQIARGWLVPAQGVTDTIDHNIGPMRVLEATASESVFAVDVSQSTWNCRPRLDDWWWRQLDCFAADYDDPRWLDCLDRLRWACDERDPLAEPPRDGLAAAGNDSVVELILAAERPWEQACVAERNGDLLVDMIHLVRSRW